jgi:hypothetical protein
MKLALPSEFSKIRTALARACGDEPVLFGSAARSLFLGNNKKFGDVDFSLPRHVVLSKAGGSESLNETCNNVKGLLEKQGFKTNAAFGFKDFCGEIVLFKLSYDAQDVDFSYRESLFGPNDIMQFAFEAHTAISIDKRNKVYLHGDFSAANETRAYLINREPRTRGDVKNIFKRYAKYALREGFYKFGITSSFYTNTEHFKPKFSRADRRPFVLEIA